MTLHCLLELVILNIQWNTQRVNNRVAEREKEEIERERVDWNLERQNLEKKKGFHYKRSIYTQSRQNVTHRIYSDF